MTNQLTNVKSLFSAQSFKFHWVLRTRAVLFLACLLFSGCGGGGSSSPTATTTPTVSFTVGGTVTGLTGSGLILQNNGGDNLSVSGAGAFTFATSIASGSPYNVSVFTQPSSPSQTCSVSNGIGAVTSANITNVAVNCVTNTFALTITKAGTGSGTVTSNPAGINCGNTCLASYNSGTSVTLTATSTVGSIFTGWTGGGCTGTGTCMVTMNAAQSITATFTSPQPFAKVFGFNNDLNTIVPAGDGSGDIYVGGFFTTYNGAGSNRIIRLNADGSADTAFVIGTGFNNAVNAIAPAGDGSGDIYVGGFFTIYNGAGSNRIIRLNADGSADTAFVVGTGFSSSVNAIAPAGDGSGDIYVGGGFTTYNGAGSKRIIRLNADGSADTAFAVGTGFNLCVFAIAPAGDGSGDIYVGGFFIIYNDARSNRIIRLNADGSADTAFAVGTGFNSSVKAIAPAGDGSGDIYVWGDFTAYKGTFITNRIARLTIDGTVR